MGNVVLYLKKSQRRGGGGDKPAGKPKKPKKAGEKPVMSETAPLSPAAKVLRQPRVAATEAKRKLAVNEEADEMTDDDKERTMPLTGPPPRVHPG